MEENIIEKKSFEFAVRVVNLYRHLTAEKKEYVISNQLLRSGTSIGANISEGVRSPTKKDITHKMSITLKEANETRYWIKLLYRTEHLTDGQYESLDADVTELVRILAAICKSSEQDSKTN